MFFFVPRMEKTSRFFWIFSFHLSRVQMFLYWRLLVLSTVCTPAQLQVCIPSRTSIYVWVCVCIVLRFTFSSFFLISLISIRFLKKECRLLHAQTVLSSSFLCFTFILFFAFCRFLFCLGSNITLLFCFTVYCIITTQNRRNVTKKKISLLFSCGR